jgi:hypothetical protein
MDLERRYILFHAYLSSHPAWNQCAPRSVELGPRGLIQLRFGYVVEGTMTHLPADLHRYQARCC